MDNQFGQSNSPTIRKLIIGAGNEFRGDDGVGLFVVRKLKDTGLRGVEIMETGGEAATLMAAWAGANRVVVVDAIFSDSPPGTVFRFDIGQGGIPRAIFSKESTHSFGVVQAIELARVLGKLPARLIVYGIAGQNFEPGEGLSVDVRQAAESIISRILDEINYA